MFERLENFWKREDGSQSVEALIILPIILVVFMSTFTYFDVFRAQSQALKANYALSDLLSRDDNVLPNEMQGAGTLFRYLTQTNSDSWVGVTVLRCASKCGAAYSNNERVLEVMWSKDQNLSTHLTTSALRASYNDRLPNMYDGEYLLMVETSSRYTPPFGGDWHGIYSSFINDMVVTKPRGAPKICYNNANCNPV